MKLLLNISYDGGQILIRISEIVVVTSSKDKGLIVIKVWTKGSEIPVSMEFETRTQAEATITTIVNSITESEARL